MKLILSRKGFDAQYGGCASPIFPDGSMVSLPIPFPNARRRMKDATSRKPNFKDHDVLADLTQGRNTANRHASNMTVHLDPYLSRDEATAPRGWKPAFGQDGSAQRHLEKERVGKGDLFLFFGWFRRVRFMNGQWQYEPKSPDVHVLFGWLQIDEVLKVDQRPTLDRRHKWLADHPHWEERQAMNSHNTIYIAQDQLALDGVGQRAGGGTFDTFHQFRQLTAPDAHERTEWLLPAWFQPAADGSPTLSYHGNLNRWSPDAGVRPGWTRLRSVARGKSL